MLFVFAFLFLPFFKNISFVVVLRGLPTLSQSLEISLRTTSSLHLLVLHPSPPSPLGSLLPNLYPASPVSARLQPGGERQFRRGVGFRRAGVVGSGAGRRQIHHQIRRQSLRRRRSHARPHQKLASGTNEGWKDEDFIQLRCLYSDPSLSAQHR